MLCLVQHIKDSWTFLPQLDFTNEYDLNKIKLRQNYKKVHDSEIVMGRIRISMSYVFGHTTLTRKAASMQKTTI